MEKTIEVDGQKVKLRSSAAFAIRYKNQFRRDPLADVFSFAEGMADIDLKEVGKDTQTVAVEVKDSFDIDTEVFYNIVWSLAKSADNSIPEPLEFFDQFAYFPLFEEMDVILDLALSSMGASVKPKKK